MNSESASQALLPSGVRDLLPPEADREYRAIYRLMQSFAAFGYQRVKPPLVEFEESLFATGPGAKLTDKTFRLMDPLSHRMMGVRSDITAQIARIASSRLAAEHRPLRLMYANDVLRTRETRQRTERQFCQVGCEFIGKAGDEADLEICLMALRGLKSLGIEQAVIDLTLPSLVDDILSDYKVESGERAAIKKILGSRDIEQIETLRAPLNTLFRAMADLSGEADKVFDKALPGNMPEYVGAAFEQLRAVYRKLTKALAALGYNDIEITMDLLETTDDSYHRGMAFALYSYGTHGELGKGGRYAIAYPDGRQESAVGFTLYMDTLAPLIAPEEERKGVYVPYNVAWDEVGRLITDGWFVVRGDKDQEPDERCAYIWKDGEIKPKQKDQS